MASHLHKPKLGPGRSFKAVTTLCVAVLMVVFLVACGGGTTQSTAQTPLRILQTPGAVNPDFFNPFFSINQGGDWGAQGLLYEGLYFTNQYTGAASPWLASSYEYSSDGTVLTFKLRTDVKWNDGQPFTSADVAYTFNLLKNNADLDANAGALWATLLKSVVATDSSTVVFTLQHVDSTALFKIGDGVYIVPQHAWSKIFVAPDKFPNDDNPVGTGPYELSSFTSDLVTYKVNPNYWGGAPAVKEVQIPSVKDNTTAITDMVEGQLDWAGIGWDPSYSPQFEQKNSQQNHTWFAASNTVMLYMNLTKAPYNNLSFRKAVNAAIDRSQLPQGVAQYAKVANPTGVIVPTYNNWISSQYQSATFTTGQTLVDTYMKQAGFVKNGSFYQFANGQSFSMTIDVVNGWNDWDQDVQFMVNDLNKAGIKATVNSESGFTPYFTAISTGAYDAAISWTDGGPSPYYGYHDLLSSANVATASSPAGGSNWEHWNAATSNGVSNQTDQLLNQYVSSTDPSVQMQAIQGIEAIMVNDLPVLPLTVNVYWDEYTTTHFTGWPTASSSYDSGAPYTFPDAEHVILNLKPVS